MKLKDTGLVVNIFRLVLHEFLKDIHALFPQLACTYFFYGELLIFFCHGLAYFRESRVLQLAHSFACDAECFPYLLQGLWFIAGEPEA